ncbi:MAG: DUF2946 family protein [Xanthobacteraceae bacterium]
MGWVHNHRRFGANLALATLLLQIVISFGHVDLGGIVGTSHLAGSHNIVIAKTSQKIPTQNNGDDDGYCPICALIQLASSSPPSLAPPLPVPAKLGGTILQASEARHIIIVSTPYSFRARAPPSI